MYALRIKWLFNDRTPGKPTLGVVSGVMLSKIGVPIYDGNILNWGRFWEQIRAIIHAKEQLFDANKLAYLQRTLKDNTTKYVIEGLTKSAGTYKCAIKCHEKRYNCPHLIH